jgi:putative tricarboxylic transport membrane protein
MIGSVTPARPMGRVRDWNNLLAGIFFIAFAVLALVLSRNLTTGSTSSMGPGYIPRFLSFLLIAFGGVIILQSFLVAGDPLEAWFPRPLFWVLASVTFFGLAIERVGLAAAVAGLIVLSTFGHRGTRPIEAIALALFMAVLSVLVFVTALRLPIPAWPVALVR